MGIIKRPALRALKGSNRVGEVSYPTDPFTILELPNASHGVPELNKIRGSRDLEALEL